MSSKYIFRVIDGEYDDGNWCDNTLWRIKDYKTQYDIETYPDREPEDTIFIGDLPEGYDWDDKRVECISIVQNQRVKGKVFGIGEIVILDPTTEREITCPWGGRKPSKWYVNWKDFNNLDKAIKYAQEVNERDDDC